MIDVVKPGPVTRWVYRRRGQRTPWLASRSDPATVLGLAVAYRYRRFHQVWARLFGYFWLPCPECGDGFAGYEGAVMERRDKLICRRCSRGNAADDVSRET